MLIIAYNCVESSWTSIYLFTTILLAFQSYGVVLIYGLYYDLKFCSFIFLKKLFHVKMSIIEVVYLGLF